MRVKLLSTAMEDLYEARLFMKNREKGWVSIFLILYSLTLTH